MPNRGRAALCGLLFCGHTVFAGALTFSSALDQAGDAEKRGDLQMAFKIYYEAGQMESNNAVNLCVLARRYCDLTYLTNSVPMQREALGRALSCSLQAEHAGSNNATAHASVAVCYARSCAFADIKTRLAYSRLFKQEAEKAIELDPKQDIAYYLLGRWNYEIARVGFFSRAYVKLVYGGLPKASNEEAMVNFKKAISLAPDRIIHHAGLAMAYETAGERDLEIVELEKCRELKPAGVEDRDIQYDMSKKLEALEQ